MILRIFKCSTDSSLSKINIPSCVVLLTDEVLTMPLPTLVQTCLGTVDEMKTSTELIFTLCTEQSRSLRCLFTF
jgi:hypothetical protein